MQTLQITRGLMVKWTIDVRKPVFLTDCCSRFMDKVVDFVICSCFRFLLLFQLLNEHQWWPNHVSEDNQADQNNLNGSRVKPLRNKQMYNNHRYNGEDHWDHEAEYTFDTSFLQSVPSGKLYQQFQNNVTKDQPRHEFIFADEGKEVNDSEEFEDQFHDECDHEVDLDWSWWLHFTWLLEQLD